MSLSDQSNIPERLDALLPGVNLGMAADVRVTGCANDSRACQPGDVFVAHAGSRFDGHDFAAEAVARGAGAVLVEREVRFAAPWCIVPDARAVLGQLCQALAGHPSRALAVIGVTGTNGKTTTTHLIASILRAAGNRVGMLGTLGYCDGLHSVAADLTTPAAADLARWLAEMRANDCSHVVMEISSHAASQQRIAGLSLAQLCITNLRRDHLDYHGSLTAYHQAKLGLVANLSADGVSVFNADDPCSVEHAASLSARRVSIALAGQADLTARLVERFKSEQTFIVSAGSMAVPVRTAMIGDHHIYNCLMAAASAQALGIDWPTIVAGLEAVRQVPGRLERIECGQPFGVFVDFAHTPDALAVSLDALREVTVGRLICVFGAGGNRDSSKRPLMGRAVESHADLAIVTNDNPRLEDPRTIAAEVLAGFHERATARWIPDRREAIHYALRLAGPDDCVLVAGRGHEPWQIIGRERIALDDRDVVRGCLYNLEPASQYGMLASVGNS